jgi:hypothetical protein
LAKLNPVIRPQTADIIRIGLCRDLPVVGMKALDPACVGFDKGLVLVSQHLYIFPVHDRIACLDIEIV